MDASIASSLGRELLEGQELHFPEVAVSVECSTIVASMPDAETLSIAPQVKNQYLSQKPNARQKAKSCSTLKCK